MSALISGATDSLTTMATSAGTLGVAVIGVVAVSAVVGLAISYMRKGR
jgi:hypothetical protein